MSRPKIGRRWAARPGVYARLALRPPPRAGWPKTLPCLVCGKMRLAATPAERTHSGCRQRVLEYYGGE